jgi:MazG family protein
MDPSDPDALESYRRLDALSRTLRGPEGCHWDRSRTLRSIAPYLVEEIHELYEAIAQADRDRIADEAGDSLFLLLFTLQVAEQEGWFRTGEVARRAEEKLVRRHPHVFADAPAASDADASLAQWEQIKRHEREGGSELLQALPASLPALLRAARLQEKASAFGFDWKTASEVLPKLREELGEIEEVLSTSSDPERLREELGDLLFAVVNLARHLGQDPEAALHAATEKFRGRFNVMARSVERAGHRMGETPLDLMEEHWQAAKTERNDPPPSPSEPLETPQAPDDPAGGRQ